MAADTAVLPFFKLSISRLARAHGAALLLQQPEALAPGETILLSVGHGVGLALVARYFQWTWPFILLLLAGVALAILMLAFKHRLGPVWLAPWFAVYLVLLLRFVYLRFLHGTIYGYFDYNPPEWGLLLLHVEAILLAAFCYTFLILLARMLESRRRAGFLAIAVLCGVSVIWSGVKYVTSRTAGATGSDPYSYVQMGIDWAERGTFVHRFSIFEAFASKEIPWYPIVPVGYHLPMNEAGDAVTVWPPGGSIAYGVAWRVLGEAGLYWVNPFFSLLTVLMSGLLAWELMHPIVIAKNEAISLLARCAVTVSTMSVMATAAVQAVWAGVTMVDSQAAFLTLLALWLALVARRHAGWRWPLLAGVALGAAYDVRHTQLLLAPALALLSVWNARPRTERFKMLVLSAVAAFLVALPDLWYHQLYLGGWLHPESEELALYSLSSVLESAGRLSQEAFAANEFGWLLPFLIYGLIQAARQARLAFATLGLVLVLSLTLHLPYPALRLRDLLPELPLVAFFIGYGIVDVARRLFNCRRSGWQLVAGLALLVIVELGLLRVWNTVPTAWQPVRPIFGYMTSGQRAAFNQLAALTPPDAVVGATLNAGAVELYARRSSLRMDGWNVTERDQALRLILQTHSAAYIVEDNRALSGILDDLRAHYRITQAARLDVPLFGDGPPAAPGALWQVEFIR